MPLHIIEAFLLTFACGASVPASRVVGEHRLTFEKQPPKAPRGRARPGRRARVPQKKTSMPTFGHNFNFERGRLPGGGQHCSPQRGGGRSRSRRWRERYAAAAALPRTPRASAMVRPRAQPPPQPAMKQGNHENYIVLERVGEGSFGARAASPR